MPVLALRLCRPFCLGAGPRLMLAYPDLMPQGAEEAAPAFALHLRYPPLLPLPKQACNGCELVYRLGSAELDWSQAEKAKCDMKTKAA